MVKFLKLTQEHRTLVIFFFFFFYRASPSTLSFRKTISAVAIVTCNLVIVKITGRVPVTVASLLFCIIIPSSEIRLQEKKEKQKSIKSLFLSYHSSLSFYVSVSGGGGGGGEKENQKLA